MRKESVLPIILASIGIVCLLGLAGFITLYNMYDSPKVTSEPSAETSEAIPALVEPEEMITLDTSAPQLPYGDEDYTESDHSFIFVGDSRTVGMKNAVLKEDAEDTCQFIAEPGEGYYWFYHHGITELEDALREKPYATVILNLGVNDLKDVENYISLYKELFSEYHDPAFYIMSVNPVVDEKCSGVSNSEIEEFNALMLKTFPDKYLDCYDYLLSEDFKTVDGLHYPDSVYCRIHHFAIMMLTGKEETGPAS